MRLAKQKHSDFYMKLHEVTQRIKVYKHLFYKRKPRYIQNLTKISVTKSKSKVKRLATREDSLNLSKASHFNKSLIVRRNSVDFSPNSKGTDSHIKPNVFS